MYNTQYTKIINYLKQHGTITPMEAFKELYITKLATRISEMRRAGYVFEKTPVVDRDGDRTVRYMRYRLVAEPGRQA